MNATWRFLAGTAVFVHYAFMAYLVVGGFVAWRWRRTIALHLLAAVWAALIVVANLDCPLTAIQNFCRERAGQTPLRGGFIDVYLQGRFYPAHQQSVAQIVLAAVVVTSWAGYLIRVHRSRSESVAAATTRRTQPPHYLADTAPRS